MKKLTTKYIHSLIKPRNADSHKGTYGHALLITGNTFKMGAAVIAAKACLRSGVGLLTVNIPEEERSILQMTIPEAMLSSRKNATKSINDLSSVGVGPGIGTSKDVKKIVIHVINKCNKPLLLDADALNILAENKRLFKQLIPQTILTPHPKEFDRLFGEHANTNDRIKTAIEKAKEYNIVIVLKGHQTLITYNGETFLNTTGNAGLAKGGSGDALTGIITAFLAQGYDAFTSARLGVYLHGLAADITLQNQSMESMLITDVIENLGKAFKEILK